MAESRRGYVRRAFGYLRRYWKVAAAAFGLVVLGTGFSLLTPWPLKILVDHVLENHPLPEALAALLGSLGQDRMSLLLVAVGAGLLITLAHNGLNVLTDYLNTKIEQHMVLDVRSDLYRHTQRLSLPYHDQKKTGRIIFAINNQGGAAASLAMSFQPLAQNVLTLAGMFAIVFFIDAQLALLSMAIVPFLYYSVGYYSKRIVPEVRRVRNLEIESLSIVHEAMSMLRVVLAFGREDHEYRRFRDQGQEAVDARVHVTLRETLFSVAVNMSTALGTALVLGFGSYRALSGYLTIGELLVVMSYIAAVYKPLEAVIYTFGSLQQNLVSLESVFGILDRTPDIEDGREAKRLERARGEVRFEDVHFSYRGRKETLAGIDFTARPGELIGVVGPTGAGKTTLVSLIPRFYDPAKGRILLDGHDLRELTVESVRAQASVVLQEPLLFRGTLADNIRYGRLDATEAEIEEAARAANAHDFIMRLPKRYETPVGERGAQLSGGERQRICIARAFLKDAPILILDEPTSAVDSRTESAILEALARLIAGRTTFLIAHRLSTIRAADRILVIDGGRLVEEGTHEELIRTDGLYRKLHDVQTGAGTNGSAAAAAPAAGYAGRAS